MCQSLLHLVARGKPDVIAEQNRIYETYPYFLFMVRRHAAGHAAEWEQSHLFSLVRPTVPTAVDWPAGPPDDSWPNIAAKTIFHQDIQNKLFNIFISPLLANGLADLLTLA